ncbi:MAG: DUF3426 domain-containing protein, partial [Wenzhouxiangellaceae bacterium]
MKSSTAPIGYTRCEHCQAALPLALEALAQAGGMVRCGGCGRTMNALARVYGAPPGDDIEPIKSTGMPPMLPPSVHQEQLPGAEPESGDGRSEPEDELPEDPGGPPILHLNLGPEPPPMWARIVWPLLALVLAAGLALQLFGPERWRLDPAMLGLGGEPPVAVSDALELVSRDMHPHPSLSDAIIVSAVIQNRDRRPVAWPTIEVRLMDASQQVVGQRRLSPEE